MKTEIFSKRLQPEEKELHIGFDQVGKTWILDTTIAKYFRSAEKHGWTPVTKYIFVDADGTETLIGGRLETTNNKPITLRNLNTNDEPDE